jgi:hypothetical protein
MKHDGITTREFEIGRVLLNVVVVILGLVLVGAP